MPGFNFDTESKLPKDARIIIQYKVREPNYGSSIITKLLYVVQDIRPSRSERSMYGYHETMVDPNLTSGEKFLLRYEIYRDGTIGIIGGMSPKSLGYEYGETISDSKIIEIKTKEKVSIWQLTSHTGFQPQKIW
jgi:hypothetical protein